MTIVIVTIAIVIRNASSSQRGAPGTRLGTRYHGSHNKRR